MLKVIQQFSRAIQKTQNISKKMRNSRYYIDEPIISQKKEASQIVEQLYFSNKQDKFEEELKQQKENQYNNSNNEINFRKIYTVKELLTYYENNPLTSSEQFVQWFSQIGYCLKNQNQIQENQRTYYKRIAGIYKAKYNKEYEQPQIIFLTVEQILDNQIFQQAMEDFVSQTEIDAQLFIRQLLSKQFKHQLYLLDFYVLQRIYEQNEYPIQTVQYISSIIKDINTNYFNKEQESQFLELFDGKIPQGQNLKKTLENLLILKMQSIEYKKLNNQEFTDFIFIYNTQKNLDISLNFVQEIIENIKERIPKLSLQQNIQICQAMLSLDIGDSQMFTYLLWNIIRLKQKITYTYPIIDGILQILLRFKQNVLIIQQSKYQQNTSLVLDFLIFPEIFNQITKDLSQFNYYQLSQLITIAYYNYADQIKIETIATNICKQPEFTNNVKLNYKIFLLYRITQITNLKLDNQQLSQIIKFKQLQLSSSTIQGFFQKKVENIIENQIISFQPYYTQEILQLVQLIWVCIVNNCLKYEEINYFIYKINEITKMQTIIKIDRTIQKLISQINQYITLHGKNMFPSKIDFNQIKNNQQIVLKSDQFENPLKLHTKLFTKEKQYFTKKYEQYLQKDIIYNDILIDYLYTNPENGDQALILLNNQNNYQISSTGEMYPNRQIQFQNQLINESNIPIVQINLPELIKCNDFHSYFEKVLNKILIDPKSEDLDNFIEQIKQLRDELKKDFNYISLYEKDNQENHKQENVNIDQDNDQGYQLSDDDKPNI